MGASIHRKVLNHLDYGKTIKVGSVLVLKNVVVFSPSKKNHYINIVIENIVKVC